MSNAPPKPKKKKEELEKEQLLKDTMRADLEKEAKLYGIEWIKGESGKLMRLVNKESISFLKACSSFDDAKFLVFIKLHESGILSQLSEKVFILLSNLIYKAIRKSKADGEREIFASELAINYITSCLLKETDSVNKDVDVNNPEELNNYIEANFQTHKSIFSKVESGFYKELLHSTDSDESKLFKDEQDSSYTLAGYTRDTATNWMSIYVDSTNSGDRAIETTARALNIVEIFFFKMKRAYECYLNYTSDVLIIHETKIVDQPLIFEEWAIAAQFPLRSIENCLFKMKNDPIDPKMFDQLKYDKSGKSEVFDKSEDELAGLDDNDKELINNIIEEHRLLKEQEFNSKVEELNNKKGRRRKP